MATPDMAELASADPAELARVHTVLTDIDDTLTTDGRLPAAAYGALEQLNAAGLRVVPVTGRPAGWCDMIARFWPVDGVVGENGSFAFRHNRETRRMIRIFEADSQTLLDRQAKLRVIGEEILREVPGSDIAADQSFRIADLAIDFCEDVPPLPATEVRRIVDIFTRHGATAKTSSIHVNGWFGAYDKLSMTKRFLTETLGLTLSKGWDGVVFVGDSPNDEPMFAALNLSVGVANIIDFADQIRAKPRFVTRQRGGEGFAEFAAALLSARAQS